MRRRRQILMEDGVSADFVVEVDTVEEQYLTKAEVVLAETQTEVFSTVLSEETGTQVTVAFINSLIRKFYILFRAK